MAKLTKLSVGFEHPAKGPQHCGQCRHFRRPNACELVTGTIEPGDWCRRFQTAKKSDVFYDKG